jgi:hypothetical protein
MQTLSFEPRYLRGLIVDTLALSDLWRALAIPDPLDAWIDECTEPASGLLEGVDWQRDGAAAGAGVRSVRVSALAALQIAAQFRWDSPAAWATVCTEIRAHLAARLEPDLGAFDADQVLASRALSRQARSFCNQAAFNPVEQQRNVQQRRTRLLWLASQGHLQVGQGADQ